MQSICALSGRILLALIFLNSGFGKLTHPDQVAGFMAMYKIPMANILVYVSGGVEFLGGLLVITGFQARLGAVLLFLFLVPTTLIFHTSLVMPFTDDMQARMQMINLMKNLAIMGGLLYVTAYGAGCASIDACCKKKSEKS